MAAWIEYRGNSARTAALPYIRPARNLSESQKWVVGLRNAEVLKGGIRVFNDSVFIARSDGVSVLDASTGDQRWNYTNLVPKFGFCVADGNPYKLVVAGNDEIRIVSEGITDTVWSEITHSTKGLNGELCNRGDYLLYMCESDDTGKIESNTLYQDSIYYSLPDIEQSTVEPIVPIASDSSIVFCSSKNTLGGAAFGEQLTIISSDWHLPTITHVPVEHHVSSPVVGHNGDIFVQEFDAASTVVNPTTSHVRYTPDNSGSFDGQTVVQGCVHTRAPIVTDQRLYVIDGYADQAYDETDELVIFSSSLDELSREELPKNLMREDPDPIAVGDVVYIALGDLLVAIDESGSQISQRQFDESIVALAGGDPGVYVGTETSVYGLTDISNTVIYQNDCCPNCQTSLSQRKDPLYCPNCGADL